MSRTEKLAKRAKQKRDAKLAAEREAKQAEKTKEEALREVARLKKVRGWDGWIFTCGVGMDIHESNLKRGHHYSNFRMIEQ